MVLLLIPVRKRKHTSLLTYKHRIVKDLVLRILVATLLVFCTAYPSIAKVNERYLLNQNAINDFYMQYGGEPLWVTGKKLNKAGEELWEALDNAWQHGLNPDSYYAREIGFILSQKSYKKSSDPELALKLELLLTTGYVRYAQDLSGMRVNAYSLDLDPKDWKQRMSVQEALSMLPHNIDNMKDYLSILGPQTATYQHLKKELLVLVKKSEKGVSEGLNPISYKGLIRPGRGYDAIPVIRARLGVVKGLNSDRYTYDTDLVSAVKSFQKEHGLQADGLIGEQTLSALNRGNKDKIRQIIVNMERLRWISDAKPERFIVVNIPSERLWAIDNGSVRFTMPVVIGSKKRPTPSFITKIHGVRFNPAWTVPETIKKEDILPHLQDNLDYLANKGMELFDGYGRDALTLDPTAIDWAGVTDKQLNSLNMVQIPGDHNPLGRIRILMPNKYNIYLHDTNDKSVFNRIDRAASSGCIRMQYPEKVALFALETREGWRGEDQMKALIKAKETKDVYTKEHAPVYLLYYTVWLSGKHQVIYGQDIYGYNNVLWEKLKKLDEIPNILDNI